MAQFILFATFLVLLSFASAFNFKDLTYEELVEKTYSLQGPFASVSDAKILLGTDEVGEGTHFKCSPTIARISNLHTLNTDIERPQVLLSGEIHGDERVGPSASYTASKLMILATQCLGVQKIYKRVTSDATSISQQESACKELAADYNINHPDQLNWLALLAAKRDTIVLPAANCHGYKMSLRTDAAVDPNRDFAYIRKDDNCLSSTTARIFNELMHRSMIQTVVTFHGGMQAIGYEWGSPNHKGSAVDEQSPDDLANRFIAGSMQVLGGSDGKKRRKGFTDPYPIGTMNSLVYPVEGGMEDWMYVSRRLDLDSLSHPNADNLI